MLFQMSKFKMLIKSNKQDIYHDYHDSQRLAWTGTGSHGRCEGQQSMRMPVGVSCTLTGMCASPGAAAFID